MRALTAWFQRDIGCAAMRCLTGFLQGNFFCMGPATKAGDARANDMAIPVKDETADRGVHPSQAVVQPGQAVGPSHHAPVAPSGRAKAHGSSGSGLLRSESK